MGFSSKEFCFYELSFEFLCCLMTPGVSKDMQHYIRQLYSHHFVSPTAHFQSGGRYLMAERRHPKSTFCLISRFKASFLKFNMRKIICGNSHFVLSHCEIEVNYV